MTITVEIKRYNPETDAEPVFKTYTTAAEPTERVLDILLTLKRTQDSTLAFRKSCAHGVCGSDAMIINGKERLACKTLVKDVIRENENTIRIEPLKHLPVQRDLMVAQTKFFDRYKAVSPYFMPKVPAPETGEYYQSQDERQRFDDPTKCILCSACYSACPVPDTKPEFIGPAASIQAARFTKDSRDKGLVPRLDALDTENGVWSCENHFQCTRVCPRGIKITKIINETKREIKAHHENT